MTPEELIDSGILELYCLGIVNDEERQLIEMFAVTNEEVRKELNEINGALTTYAASFSVSKISKVKKQIFNRIELSTNEPPFLNPNSSADDWLDYLSLLELKPPMVMNGIAIEELSTTSSCVTMVLWGEKGGIIPDEEHEDLNEHLFICYGACEMTIDGRKSVHKAGDYLCIRPHQIHSGVVTSNDGMIAIVQRRAA